MEYVLFFLLATLVSWVSLLIVIPLAQLLADFSMPPWPERMWKLAVVAAVGNAISMALDPVSGFLAWIVGFIVFWALMVKWFDVDLFGAVIIVFVSWGLRILLTATLFGAVTGAA